MNNPKRWKAAALSIKAMLENFAVIGAALAAYEQKLWPAWPMAIVSALLAVIIAYGVPHD